MTDRIRRTVALISLSLLALACSTTTPSPTLVRNGDFEQWSRGASADPDGWARVADIGRVERAAATHQADGYAAKYTRVDSNVNAFQDLSGYESSAAVTCSAWAVADKKQVARVVLDDGASFSYSSFNQTADSSESLSVTHTIRPGTTRLRLVLDVSGESPRLTVPGTAATFEDVSCRPVTPSLSSKLEEWNETYRLYDRALEVLIALTAALGVLAWYRLKRGA